MGDGSLKRLGLGAPNEERFGFVQTVVLPVGDGAQLFISGQVGKDNTTGSMRPATSFAEHASNALANVEEALSLSDAPATALSCIAFVPRLEEFDDEALAATKRVMPREMAVTVIGVAELSSPDYCIEVSVTAVAEEDPVTAPTPIPWPSAAPVGAISDVAGVDVGGVVHLAGHLAWNPDGSLMGGTTAEQLTGCYAAIDRTLSSAGLPRAALVAEHVFVVARDDEALDFVAICDAHRTATAGRNPASTLVPVTSLAVPGALACVAAVAAVADGTPG